MTSHKATLDNGCPVHGSPCPMLPPCPMSSFPHKRESIDQSPIQKPESADVGGAMAARGTRGSGASQASQGDSSPCTAGHGPEHMGSLLRCHFR